MKKFFRAALAAVLAVLLILPAYASSPVFEDVTGDHWAAADIRYVTRRKLFNGVSDTRFNPSGHLSMAMLATVLYRCAGSPEVSGPAPYIDVPEDQWYSPGVAWAHENRIFPLRTQNAPQLDVNADVRRAEFCVMLYNFAAALGQPVPNSDSPTAPNSFTDMDWILFSSAGCATLYSEAETAMLSWALPLGIMEGVSDTSMDPLGSLSRAQAAAMLSRFDKTVLGNAEPLDEPDPIPTPAPAEPEPTPSPAPAEPEPTPSPAPVEPEPTPSPTPAVPEPTPSPAPAEPDPAPSPTPATPALQLTPVKLVWQNPELPNGCEATSLAILLSCTGTVADKMDVLANYLPKQPFTWSNGVRYGPDPQVAYAGDAAAKSGGWYCFENPVIQAGDAWLKAKGLPCRIKNLTGLSREELEVYLSRETPVVVWATLRCQTPRFSSYPWTLPNGTKYYPYINLHCFVLTGIAGGKFYAADPIYGWQALVPDAFWQAFDAMGRRAVTLEPVSG